MLRLIGPVVLVVALVMLFQALRAGTRDVAARRRARRIGPAHDWEPRTQQISRRVKGLSLPDEDREAILAFLQTRTGVEAYMEPKTMMQPLSVVLVAIDGEWKRFPLQDDSFIRGLARTNGLSVFDAAKVGYPERMRRYKRDKPEQPER